MIHDILLVLTGGIIVHMMGNPGFVWAIMIAVIINFKKSKIM